MIKAVIDTNGLLNAIPKRGSKKWLYNAFISERFIWVFSNEILTEYDELICRKFSPIVSNYVISSLLISDNHQHLNHRISTIFLWKTLTTESLSIVPLALMLIIW